MISEANLLTYLQGVRSIAAHAGYGKRMSLDDLYDTAQSDDIIIYAIDVLHRMQYDTAKALQHVVKVPIPPGYEDKKWTEEEQKKFMKGFRQYGKNFFRIHKELLPHRQTSELVEYYYLWKKTPQAINSRSRRRFTRPSSSTKKCNSKDETAETTITAPGSGGKVVMSKAAMAAAANARSTTPITSSNNAPSLPSTPSQSNKKASSSSANANNNGICCLLPLLNFSTPLFCYSFCIK